MRMCVKGPGLVLTSSVSSVCFRVYSEFMQTVTQLFVILQALHCALALSPQCGSAEDSRLILYVATANIYAQEHV